MKTKSSYQRARTILIVCGLMIGCSFSAFSQMGRFSAGLELGVPLGNFSNFSNFGIGASGKYEAPIPSVDKLNWTASLGFLSFGGKDNLYNQGYSVSYSVVPVIGGVKYYLDSRFSGFYGSAEAGFSFFSGHVSGNNGPYGNYGGTTRFTFAPGAGYQYGNFDFSGKFQLNSDFSFFNIRAAYVFGGK